MILKRISTLEMSIAFHDAACCHNALLEGKVDRLPGWGGYIRMISEAKCLCKGKAEFDMPTVFPAIGRIWRQAALRRECRQFPALGLLSEKVGDKLLYEGDADPVFDMPVFFHGTACRLQAY